MSDNNTYAQLEGHLGMCADGCASTRAGHAELAVQRIVAAASPSAYRDAIVTHALDGALHLVDVANATHIRLWHHSPVTFEVGEPVAYHPVAGIVVAGATRISVR